jgi:hypothetical protein
VTSNADRIGLRYSPMAFTEHGILMLSSVLNSTRAVQVNIEIMRAFVKLRQMLSYKSAFANGVGVRTGSGSDRVTAAIVELRSVPPAAAGGSSRFAHRYTIPTTRSPWDEVERHSCTNALIKISRKKPASSCSHDMDVNQALALLQSWVEESPEPEEQREPRNT